MKLPDGKYKTKNGSTLEIKKGGGAGIAVFDWLEEDNACCECQVSCFEQDGFLTWSCDECGGGQSELMKDE